MVVVEDESCVAAGVVVSLAAVVIGDEVAS
jgi:hypothetical protein